MSRLIIFLALSFPYFSQPRKQNFTNRLIIEMQLRMVPEAGMGGRDLNTGKTTLIMIFLSGWIQRLVRSMAGKALLITTRVRIP